jgi:hypothetical protein
VLEARTVTEEAFRMHTSRIMPDERGPRKLESLASIMKKPDGICDLRT